jgi:hypothetical protein
MRQEVAFMFKKLGLSALTIGLVSAALAYGAYAYFFNGSTTAVTVGAASALDITYDIDLDCNGVGETLGLMEIPATTTVSDLFPGDSRSACVILYNNNDTDVDVYAKNANFSDDAGGLFLDVLQAQVINWTANTTPCQFDEVEAAQYTTDNDSRGCLVGNVAANGSVWIQADVRFYDDGNDQSSLAGATAEWDASLDAYTTP